MGDDAPHRDRSLVNLSHHEQLVTEFDESFESQIEIIGTEIIDRRFHCKFFAVRINTRHARSKRAGDPGVTTALTDLWPDMLSNEPLHDQTTQSEHKDGEDTDLTEIPHLRFRLLWRYEVLYLKVKEKYICTEAFPFCLT